MVFLILIKISKSFNVNLNEIILISKHWWGWCLLPLIRKEGFKTMLPLLFSFAGQCPVYNYAFGATTATGRSCTNFAKGCPDPKPPPYHSSSFYKCTFSFFSFYGSIKLWFHFFQKHRLITNIEPMHVIYFFVHRQFWMQTISIFLCIFMIAFLQAKL